MITRLSYILAITNLVVVLYFAYLAFFPFQVIDLQQQPYILNERYVKAGSYIFYKFDYCKYYDVPANIIYQLENRDYILALTIDPIQAPATPQQIDDYTLRLTKGCGEATKAVYIPSQTPPGSYTLAEYVDYQVTPLQKVSYIFRTEPFEVYKD